MKVGSALPFLSISLKRQIIYISEPKNSENPKTVVGGDMTAPNPLYQCTACEGAGFTVSNTGKKLSCKICLGTGKHPEQLKIEAALEDIYESLKGYRNSIDYLKNEIKEVESFVNDYRNDVRRGSFLPYDFMFYQIEDYIHSLGCKAQSFPSGIKRLRSSIRVFNKEHGFPLFNGVHKCL
ncbi:MAG: hypothetical protein P3T54_04035 [Dehalogenimonas sp.]|uniref:HEPN/RES N-terminal domain-containing protein n=1 Tax=Candidatus Dehalogenimonas loeffleri TaxID=3127115 RepID=A0ABZ2J2W5_9CHLR|nr:hypothetical protein [Dehalogenimonas sp.]